ncbi:GlxA family transcriptional regulator [Paraburkholderia diazotrophica]|uniref:Transcriptional regulator GlxA family, contains an amidase domain and an AraC-type DNA-binding HTH domain n=1 Tax=Paraburkholderia diazotrophica TaxID=667676 RepID=A0A1H7BEP3_9BURK|nr:GlxA family transcriptional regulator [Paraburkholderia diazotrophica]SEJ76079.1 Transcriptional regulator GlxA family, contains an amidase domain and an AraC-type DNA-binding HTH domain [Paraburkholderia diazotrophica]
MEPAPVRFGIVLLPNFTLTALSGFIDTLRLASDVGDKSRPERCTWQIVGENLRPVRASCGVQMSPWTTFDGAVDYQYIVVVGGLLHSGSETTEATLEYLRRAASSGASLVGICTGAFALARAGLVDKQQICISWFHYEDFLERFPFIPTNLVVTDSFFVADGNLITCSGGAASIDVAAATLRRHIAPEVVSKALRILQVADPGARSDQQPFPPSVTSQFSPKIRRAIALMEQHLSSPLGLDELAARVDASPRQLERLFTAETSLTPASYARLVRVRVAVWLLRRSRKSISDVAEVCGFTDVSHLGRELKRVVGITPKECRDMDARKLPEALRTLLEGRDLARLNSPVMDTLDLPQPTSTEPLRDA